VTETLRTDLPRLPEPVARLLDDYVGGRPETAVRLWSLQPDGEWLCVYPETFGAPGGPGPGPRAPLDGTTHGHLEIELDGPGGQRDLDFLVSVLEQVLAHETEARSAAHELSERYEEINLLYSISEILASFLSMERPPPGSWRRWRTCWAPDGPPSGSRTRKRTGSCSRPPWATRGWTDPSTSTRSRRSRPGLPGEAAHQPGVGGPAAPEHAPGAPTRWRGAVPVGAGELHAARRGEAGPVGVITLVGRRTDVRFSAGDLRLLTAIASQVAAALETQRLVKESLRRERVERELELAHDLQLKLLPDAARFGSGERLSARCAPADSVGGDLYHLFELSNGRLGVVIADVSSHGFSAALIMALTMSAIAIYAQEADQPGEVLRKLHKSLIDELESTEMYMTILFAVVDPAAGEVVYANAGHPHAFMVSEDGAVVRLDATSPPLGTFTFPEYGEKHAPTRPEDLMLLFTDGLSDAFSGEAGITGEQQLLAEVIALRANTPQAIMDHLFDAAGSGKNNVPPDDRTAVILRI
jgi:phosphoserine phosphatase RsbU/P